MSHRYAPPEQHGSWQPARRGSGLGSLSPDLPPLSSSEEKGGPQKGGFQEKGEGRDLCRGSAPGQPRSTLPARPLACDSVPAPLSGRPRPWPPPREHKTRRSVDATVPPRLLRAGAAILSAGEAPFPCGSCHTKGRDHVTPSRAGGAGAHTQDGT